MKKKLIALLTATASLATSCAGTKAYSSDNYITRLKTEQSIDEFLICEWNDLHIANTTNMDRQLAYLEMVINSYGKVSNSNKKPDLIVLNGDSFMEATKAEVDKFFSWLNSQKIPFAYTYGNHDLQGQYSNSYVDEAVKKYSMYEGKGYSVLKNPVDDNVYGDANYVVNIYDKDTSTDEAPNWQVYVFDSNTYYGFGYDNIHDDQVKWYSDIVKETTASNDGKPVPSLMFFHIPTEDFKAAWEKGGKTVNHYNSETGEFWHMGESVSSSKLPTKLFDAVEELGSTKGIICAHDHINLTDFHYSKKVGSTDYVRLMFGLKTGDGIYHDTNYMGASFYELKKDGSFKMKNIKVGYDGSAEIIDVSKLK